MKEEDYADFFDREDKAAVVDNTVGLAAVRPSLSLLWILQRGKCYWCDKVCPQPTKEWRRKHSNRTLPLYFFTVDHIQSRWQGGDSAASNCVGACYHCNWERNTAEQKRGAGRRISPNQPEETRLKRFLPSLAKAETVPFVRGLSRRQREKKHLALSVEVL